MRIINLTFSENLQVYFGYYEDNKKFYKFQVDSKDVVGVQMVRGEFKDYNHFAGVFSKFNPYTFFWKKPAIVKKITWKACEKLKDRIIKLKKK